MRMKAFRIFLLMSLPFLAAVSMSAQDAVELVRGIRAGAADACVKVTYSFTAKSGDVVVRDDGYVEAQDDMWHLSGETVDIYTDGTSTWVADPDAMEVIVEPAWTYDDLESFYASVMKADTSIVVEIVSTEKSEKKPVSRFTPTFGPEWIVTDLR